MALTTQEKSELDRLDAELDAAIFAAKERRNQYIRKLAKEKGLLAESLEELKSKSEKPFVEVEGHFGFRQARTENIEEGEEAYLCAGRYSKVVRCGWVKGSPVERRYDEIGFLCGSAGNRYFCIICGEKIGEDAMIVS